MNRRCGLMLVMSRKEGENVPEDLESCFPITNMPQHAKRGDSSGRLPGRQGVLLLQGSTFVVEMISELLEALNLGKTV